MLILHLSLFLSSSVGYRQMLPKRHFRILCVSYFIGYIGIQWVCTHIYHHPIIVSCCSLCTLPICIWQTPPLFQYRLTAVLASHLDERFQLHTAHPSSNLNIDGTDKKPHQPPSKFATGCGMSNISNQTPCVLTSRTLYLPQKHNMFKAPILPPIWNHW